MSFFFLTRTREVANAVAPRTAPKALHQPEPMVGAPEPPNNQRTLDLGLAQAKGFVSAVASEAAISGLPTVGSNVDWQSATRGIDLMLTSSHEFASRQAADQDTQLERSAYINAVQHVLHGLPHNLNAAELAMLQRALPHSLARLNTWWRGPNGQQQEGVLARGQRNVVQNVLVVVLYWLYFLAMWFESVGLMVIAVERQHAYASRLLLAAFNLACIAGRWLRTWSEFWPCRILLAMLKYVAVGALGAFFEVWERVVAEEGTRGNVNVTAVGEAEEGRPPVPQLSASFTPADFPALPSRS